MIDYIGRKLDVDPKPIREVALVTALALYKKIENQGADYVAKVVFAVPSFLK
tara:strand:- start:5382 stop:5537 length:156 start_codon:yes stop_codon:yes gene_type:complete